MSGIPEIRRAASAGNVGLVIVAAAVMLLIAITAFALFMRRKQWHLDGEIISQSLLDFK